MKLHAAKLLATVLCVSSVWGASAAPAEAFIFPWCWGGGGCSPCGSGCGYGTYYGPVSYGYGGCGPCGSACSPCGSSCSPCTVGCAPCGGYSSCAPCGTSSCAPCGGVSSCAPCASGDCTLGPASDDKWRSKEPRTYRPDAPDLGQPGNLGRTEGDAGLNEGDTSRETRKVTPRPAPPPSSTEDNKGAVLPISPRLNIGPSVPAASRDRDVAVPKLPTMSFDDKIAARPAPERKRLQTGHAIGEARLVRQTVLPNSGWAPVEPDSKIAKK